MEDVITNVIGSGFSVPQKHKWGILPFQLFGSQKFIPEGLYLWNILTLMVVSDLGILFGGQWLCVNTQYIRSGVEDCLVYLIGV